MSKKIKCPKCNGEGSWVENAGGPYISYTYPIMCNKCGGEGEIDWIDELFPNNKDKRKRWKGKKLGVMFVKEQE